MHMYLYKVVAHFGLDSELDSMIFWRKTEAIEVAKLWLKNEDCDGVSIYYEEAQNDGIYHTIGGPIYIKREGD